MIYKRVLNVAYDFELPAQLVAIHIVFHISMVMKYFGDPSLIVPKNKIGIKDNLSYQEIPIEILRWLVLKLRSKEVASVKVL